MNAQDSLKNRGTEAGKSSGYSSIPRHDWKKSSGKIQETP